MRAKRAAVAVVALSASLGLAAGVGARIALNTPTKAQFQGGRQVATEKQSNNGLGTGPAANLCGRNASLGILVELRPRHSLSELRNAGFQASPFLTDLAGAIIPEARQLSVVSPPSGASSASTVADLVKVSAVAIAATVNSQSADPNLRSCAYDLSDRPQASVLATKVADVARSEGFLNSNALIELVSDDPLNSQDLIVTIEEQGSVVGHEPGPLGGQLHELRAISAIVTRAGSVVALGYAPW
ncbi:MAG: hypothetical protein M0Z29_04565 [Actinomycetota bacterium]|nr:hypothetical protein [Actinomycetota bacterium]